MLKYFKGTGTPLGGPHYLICIEKIIMMGYIVSDKALFFHQKGTRIFLISS